MKKTFIYVSVLAISLVFWFLRAKMDATAMQTRDAQIASLRDAVQTRDELLAQSRALTALHADNLELLKDRLKEAGEAVAKDETQIATLKRAQEADQTIIASLKNDNDADIRALREQIQTKDDQIAQLNEKLVQTIAYYQTKLNAANDATASGPTPAPPQDDGKKIYPKDDGFDAQSLGTGMFAYQVFSQLNNPTNAPQPPSIPNTSPWTFGGTGNSGISANEAFYVTNAKNGDHDGKTSQAGQAAFLQFKGSWFSQKIKLPAGTYRVGFDFEARRDYGEADGIAVSLNGKDVYAGAPTDANNFSQVTSETITLAAAGEYELKFRGLGALNDPAGDHTTFIDNICINVVESKNVTKGTGLKVEPNVSVQNVDPDKDAIYPKDDGFEAQDLGQGFMSYQEFGGFVWNPNNVPEPAQLPNKTPWKFEGAAGIAANNSGFYVANATNRDHDGTKSTSGQAGVLTLDGSAISQSIHLRAGTYVVVFGLEARRDYNPNHISVQLDGKTVFQGVITDTNTFQQIVTMPLDLPKDGDYVLKFCGHGGAGKLDGDSFIDDVRIRPIDPSAVNSRILQIQEALSGIRQ